jgi:HMG-box domain
MKPTKASAEEGDQARKLPAAPAGHMQSSEDEAGEGSAKGSSLKKTALSKKKSPRKKYKKKPKNMPHRALSAYNVFFREERSRILRARQDGNPGEIGTARAAQLFSAMGKIVAKRWKELSPSERVPYMKEAREDVARYHREMVLYHSSHAATQGDAEGKEESKQANANEPIPAQRAQSSSSELIDADDTARNQGIAGAVTLQQPFAQQIADTKEALSALNDAVMIRHQQQQQQLLRQQQQQQQMLEILREEQLRNRESSVFQPSSFLGLTAVDFLTPEEQFMSLFSYNRLVSSTEQQQQLQRLELPGNQYIRAALEQAQGNFAAASIVRHLQWQQQQQQQQQIEQQASFLLQRPPLSFPLQEPPLSLARLSAEEAGGLYSGLGESLPLSSGTLSAALIQRLQHQTQQQAGAAAFGASHWRHESNESSDESSEC